MLPAQKEIREDSGLVSLEDHIVPSSGKLIDSANVLRERLDAIDLNEMTHAVERISTFQERLLGLQRTMAIVAEVSSCQARVLQARHGIEQELNRLKVEILRKPFSPRQLEDKDKLITIRGLQTKLKQASNQVDPLSATMVDAIAPTRQESDSFFPFASSLESHVNEKTQEAAHVFTLTDKITTHDQELNSVADMTPRYELPTSDAQSLGSDEEQVGTRRLGQDLQEEFADEPVVETTEADWASEPYNALSFRVAGQRSQESTPATEPMTVDFDKKLLDDLIKNYGEFVVSPHLPATVEPVNPSKKSETQSRSRASSQLDRASDKTVVSYSSHGELDQKLKKLIKDYGQVDLYSQRSWVKTKMHAIGAFAVLGAVLSGIYFFFTPKPNVAINPSPTHAQEGFEPTAGASSYPADKDSAVVDKGSGQLPDLPPKATEASRSFALKAKQTSQKNIKKGGSK
jgi:hypothetical protein